MFHRPHLLLASNSPRRRQLLTLGNWTFEVTSTSVDESQLENEQPGEYVVRLAAAKARVAARTAGSDLIVLGADTAVVDGDVILGKPADAREAISMLRHLRGHIHKVFTGIALLHVGQGILQTDLCVTDVPMRAYSDDEITGYVSSGDPLDKAGAYAIQHSGFDPVDNLQGCYASVMGLPLCHIVRTLRKMEFPVDPAVAQNCQEYLDYACPVSKSILNFQTVG